MSKIQDALSKLRNSGTRETLPPGSSREKQQTADSALSVRKASMYEKQERSPGGNGSAGFRGELDLDSLATTEVMRSSLVEHGLVPRGVDSSDLPEQFRRIKRPILNLAFGASGEGIEHRNVVMLASALPGAGKSFCAFNLALSISRERDTGVVLIDADVLKPNISDAFGLTEAPGLIDYLLHPEISLRDILFRTNIQDIVAVPSGQRHEEATELLASRRMEALVHSISVQFPSRVILLDAPPLLVTNEAQVLSEQSGQIILVIDAGSSTQDSVLHALEALNRDKPINAILNKARGFNIGSYGFGYREETGYSASGGDS